MEKVLKRWDGSSWVEVSKVAVYRNAVDPSDLEVYDIYNGYNNQPTQWVVIQFNNEVKPFSSYSNLDAFIVTGYRSGTVTAFVVKDIIRVDGRTIAIQTDDFDACDAYLNVTYLSSYGALLDNNNRPLKDFALRFAIDFPHPTH